MILFHLMVRIVAITEGYTVFYVYWYPCRLVAFTIIPYNIFTLTLLRCTCAWCVDMTVLVCCMSNKCCLLTNTILLSFYNPPFQHKTSHPVCASNLYILEPNKGMFSSSIFIPLIHVKIKKRHGHYIYHWDSN